MELRAIKFNHSLNTDAVNALSIRQNAVDAIGLPEWVKGKTLPKSSPAAYSIRAVVGKIITIQASFAADLGEPSTVEIRAEGGGILGPIKSTAINMRGGVSVPEFVTLELGNHRIGPSGILRQDITWEWFYKAADGTWVSMGNSSHRIYVVLDAPFLPWLQPPTPDASLSQLPWVDALDYACLWADGKLDPLGAATKITETVNGSLGLTYDTSHGATKYTQVVGSNSWFLCTPFLAFLNRQPEGKGNVVNCTDCATIVTTFANLLGCHLTAAVLNSPGGFLCNKIIAIGGGSVWDYPFPPANRFAYHEVAWMGGFSYGDPILDACLMIDNSGDPWDWITPSLSHTPVLPVNEIFTKQPNSPNLPVPTPFIGAGYRERLAQNSVAGIGRCVPIGPWPKARGGRRGLI